MSRVGPTRISRMIGLLLTAAKRALRWSTRDVAKKSRLDPFAAPFGYDRYLRIPAEDWSRGGSDLSQIKCLRRGADNAAANCGLN